MMFKEYFMLLLFAHIIGDFYAQTDFVVQKKKAHLHWVLIHGFCYWAVVLIVSMPVMSKQVAFFGSIFAVIHLLVDLLKYIYVSVQVRKKELIPNFERNIFFADQSLHLLSIASIAYMFIMQDNLVYVSDNITQILTTIGLSAKSLLTWVVALLVIHKPVNIAISLLLTPYKPDNKDEDSKLKDKNAGRFIGTLERVIIIFLISLKQYSAIGLVLTAKSIARYDKITKDPAFSEYYLLGTLLSTLAVIIISFIL